MKPARAAPEPSGYLHIPPKRMLLILTLHPNKWMSSDDILKYLGKPTDVADNHHAVIWSTSRLLEQEKIEKTHECRGTKYRFVPRHSPYDEEEHLEVR